MGNCAACAGSGVHLTTGDQCPECSGQTSNRSHVNENGPVTGASFAGSRNGGRENLDTGNRTSDFKPTEMQADTGKSAGENADKNLGKNGGVPKDGLNPRAGGAADGANPAADLKNAYDNAPGEGKTDKAAYAAGSEGTRQGLNSATSGGWETARKVPGVKKVTKKVEDTGGKAAQKAKKRVAKVGKAGAGVLALLMILMATVVGGVGSLVMTGSLIPGGRSEVTPPKPSVAQCATMPEGWCEVVWATQEEIKRTGGVPVPWSTLAAIAKSQTDSGRYSPTDSIDRDPGRGQGLDGGTVGVKPGSTHHDVFLLGDSLAEGVAPHLKNNTTLTLQTDAKVSRTLPQGIEAITDPNSGTAGGVGGEEGTGSGKLTAKSNVSDNVVVYLGTNPAGNVKAFKSQVNTLLDRLDNRNVYWMTLHAVGAGKAGHKAAAPYNKALTDATKKHANLKLIDSGALIESNPEWWNTDPMKIHLTSPGYKKVAKLISTTLATAPAVDDNKESAADEAANQTASYSDEQQTSALGTSSNVNIVTTAETAPPPAGGTPLTTPLKDLWKKYYSGNNFHNSGSWSLGFHTGQDFGAPIGTPVYAVANSIVMGAGAGESGSCGKSSAWGNAVVLKVNDGQGVKEVTYNHLSTIKVQKGQKVAAGQYLGKTGMTGRTFGPHLHFEVRNGGTCPFGGNPDKSLVDPVKWLKGAAATNPTGETTTAGLEIGGTANNEESSIPDEPDWVSNINVLNREGSSTVCPVETPTPAIKGANGSEGPYLLNSSEAAAMRDRGEDPQNICQATMHVAKTLRQAETLKNVASDHPEKYEAPTPHNVFWEAGLQATDILVSPKADDTNCTQMPTGLNTASKITWAINCQTAKHKQIYVITGAKDKNVADFSEAGEILAQEAVHAAAVYSKLGAEKCDNKATYAGVLGISQKQAESVKINGASVDRCDEDENIIAAAKILVDGEATPVEKRTTTAGPYQPMLGGWANFPWALGNNANTFSKNGPGEQWELSDKCLVLATDWVANLTKTTSPLAGSDFTNDKAKLEAAAAGALAASPTVGSNKECAAATAGLFYSRVRGLIGVSSTVTSNPDLENVDELTDADKLGGLRMAVNPIAANPLAKIPAQTSTSSETAERNLAAWLEAHSGDGGGTPPSVGRLSVDGNTALADHNVDMSVMDSTPRPGGLADRVKEIVTNAQAVAGGPVDNKWERLKLGGGDSCLNPDAANVAISGGSAANAGIVYRFLKTSLGATDEGAAGVLGNIQQESSMSPKTVEASTGEGHGLIQWSFGRKTALLNAAKKQNVPWQDMNFQLNFMKNELEKSYKSALKVIQTSTDVIDATVKFHNIYEGSADTAEYVRNGRGKYSKQHYAKIKAGKYGVASVANTVPAAATDAAPAETNEECGTGLAIPVSLGEFAPALKRPDKTIWGGKWYRDSRSPHSVGGVGCSLSSCSRSEWGVADIGAKAGTPIYAHSDGVVLFAGASSSYNPGYIKVKVAGGGLILYAHQVNFQIKAGDRIKTGQYLSKVAKDHLHLEWRKVPSLVDHGCNGPMPWLPGRKDPGPGVC